MEKTLLESTLERYLPTIGFKLGERVYAGDLDFQADLEDTMTEVKSTDPNFIKFISMFNGRKMSEAQLNRRENDFLTRESNVINGLGFKYWFEPLEDTKPKSNAEFIVDEIVRNRRFGELGFEGLQIWYSSDYSWRSVGKRFGSSLVRQFYRTICNLVEGIYADKDYKLRVEQDYLEEYFSNQIFSVKSSLDAIAEEFDGKTLNKDNIPRLMGYLNQLKGLVE